MECIHVIFAEHFFPYLTFQNSFLNEKNIVMNLGHNLEYLKNYINYKDEYDFMSICEWPVDISQ